MIFDVELLSAAVQVIMIDLVLAGDNAVVIGLAVAGLPATQRTHAVLFGILTATVLRIAFALVAVELLQIVGLALAGGILLLWVCWKMWRELRVTSAAQMNATEAILDVDLNADGVIAGAPGTKTLRQAIGQIVIADVSMSLDNVIAVAAAAREHPGVLVFGLTISIALMGLAASLVAKLLQSYHWISYIGLALILYVSIEMIRRGIREVTPILMTAFA